MQGANGFMIKIRNQRTAWRWFFIAAGMLGAAVWCVLFFMDINGLQRNVFFYDTNDWFMDLYNVAYYSLGRSPYSWGWIPSRCCLPLAFVIFYPLIYLFPYDITDQGTSYAARYSQFSAVAGLIIMLLFVGFLFYCLYRAINGRERERLGILAVFFCSAITLYSIERANQVIVAAAFVCVFLMTYRSKSKLMNHLGYFSLAVAAALKIFPCLFGVLLIYDKKYKAAVITAVEGFLLSFLPFLLLKGNLIDNIRLCINAIYEHSVAYAIGILGINAPTIFDTPLNLHILPYVLTALSFLCAGSLKEEWKKIMLLTLGTLLASGQQGYYCLLYLFFPMVLFLNQEHKPGYIAYLIGFLLLLVPLQYEASFLCFHLTNYTVANTVCLIMYIVLIAESVVAFITKHRRIKAVVSET